MEKRFNQGYEIIQSIEVGNTEFVLGVNVKAPSQYVTWECSNKTDYYWGHYINNQLQAIKDLCERVMGKVEYLEQKEQDIRENHHNNYVLVATVKNGSNIANIPFPTRELSEILGSIGITQPPEKIYLGGYSDIKVHLQQSDNEVSNALLRLFQNDNSLQMVNEVAKAVFHSDWRVYEMVENNLKKGSYKTVESVLRDATDYSRYLMDRKKSNEREER